jgi:hypothetical protein
MNFSAYSRSIVIEETPLAIVHFAQLVPNLPSWTHFFVQVGAKEGAGYAVETRFGSAITWIDKQLIEGGYRLDLCSLIHERLEKAHLYIETAPTGAQVTFEVRLPDEWPPERVSQQLHGVESELKKLKALLELRRTLKDAANCLEHGSKLLNSLQTQAS